MILFLSLVLHFETREPDIFTWKSYFSIVRMSVCSLSDKVFLRLLGVG